MKKQTTLLHPFGSEYCSHQPSKSYKATDGSQQQWAPVRFWGAHSLLSIVETTTIISRVLQLYAWILMVICLFKPGIMLSSIRKPGNFNQPFCNSIIFLRSYWLLRLTRTHQPPSRTVSLLTLFSIPLNIELIFYHIFSIKHPKSPI